MATLIIGGSGMLLQATQEIVNVENQVLLCSRDKNKYKNLLNNHDSAKFLQFDFSDANDFKKLGNYINDEKINIINIIIWIHSSYYKYFYELLENIKADENTSIYLCKGNNSMNLDNSLFEKYKVHIIKLGYNDIDNRWLTHEEISNGVLESFRNKKSVHVGHVTR